MTIVVEYLETEFRALGSFEITERNAKISLKFGRKNNNFAPRRERGTNATEKIEAEFGFAGKFKTPKIKKPLNFSKMGSKKIKILQLFRRVVRRAVERDRQGGGANLEPHPISKHLNTPPPRQKTAKIRKFGNLATKSDRENNNFGSIRQNEDHKNRTAVYIDVSVHAAHTRIHTPTHAHRQLRSKTSRTGVRVRTYAHAHTKIWIKFDARKRSYKS